MKSQHEHRLQVMCIKWFRLKYKTTTIFAIPNGGKRNAFEAKRLKDEGVLAGVADLFVMCPNRQYAGLFIEMKVKPNKQSDSQIAFQINAKRANYQYAVCYSLDEFINIVDDYFKDLN